MVAELIRGMSCIYGNQNVLDSFKFNYFHQFLNHVLKQNLWFWKYGYWNNNGEITGSRGMSSGTGFKS